MAISGTMPRMGRICTVLVLALLSMGAADPTTEMARFGQWVLSRSENPVSLKRTIWLDGRSTDKEASINLSCSAAIGPVAVLAISGGRKFELVEPYIVTMRSPGGQPMDVKAAGLGGSRLMFTPFDRTDYSFSTVVRLLRDNASLGMAIGGESWAFDNRGLGIGIARFAAECSKIGQILPNVAVPGTPLSLSPSQ